MIKSWICFMAINTQIVITFILLIGSILFFALTSIDEQIQENFFNFNTNSWQLNRHTDPYHFIFYTLSKKLLIIFGVGLLFSLLFLKNTPFVQTYKKGILIVVLSAIFIPLVVGGLKKSTNMPCPRDEIHYGGSYPKTAVWERYSKSFQNKKKMLCWPAGHASGGFALLSLFFLFRKQQNRYLALLFALGVGWSMGGYKMLIGDHFFSHTVITMILAWLIVLVIAKGVKYETP